MTKPTVLRAAAALTAAAAAWLLGSTALVVGGPAGLGLAALAVTALVVPAAAAYRRTHPSGALFSTRPGTRAVYRDVQVLVLTADPAGPARVDLFCADGTEHPLTAAGMGTGTAVSSTLLSLLVPLPEQPTDRAAAVAVLEDWRAGQIPLQLLVDLFDGPDGHEVRAVLSSPTRHVTSRLYRPTASTAPAQLVHRG